MVTPFRPGIPYNYMEPLGNIAFGLISASACLQGCGEALLPVGGQSLTSGPEGKKLTQQEDPHFWKVGAFTAKGIWEAQACTTLIYGNTC